MYVRQLTYIIFFKEMESKIMTNDEKRRAIEALKTQDVVEDIYRTLTPESKRLMGAFPNERTYLTKNQLKWVAKRFIINDGKIPVAFFDILTDGVSASVCMAVRQEYQGKGYGSRICQMGNNWINQNIDNYNHFEWNVISDNKASIALAKRMGFKRQPSRDYTNKLGKFVSFVKNKYILEDAKESYYIDYVKASRLYDEFMGIS